MLRSSFSLDVRPVQEAVQSLRSRALSAGVRAANNTAVDVRDAIRQEVRAAFRNVVPFVVNAVRVTHWAKREEPQAVVDVARTFGVRGEQVDDIFRTQVYGGTRKHKLAEIRIGWLSPGGRPIYMMPARFATYDSKGNPSRGELTQILSQLGVLNRGDNRAARKAKRVRKPQTEYFVIWSRGEAFNSSGWDLKPGIYRRNSAGRALPVYMFMKGKPQYRKRLQWHETARKTVAASAPKHFREEMARRAQAANDRAEAGRGQPEAA